MNAIAPDLPANDLVAVSAIIFGFGVAIFIFRLQREISVMENHPDWPIRLAWADYLILISIALVSAGLITLLASPFSTLLPRIFASDSVLLQLGYIPAIFAHYRIVVGARRTGPRQTGEPAERFIVIGTILVATTYATGLWYFLKVR